MANRFYKRRPALLYSSIWELFTFVYCCLFGESLAYPKTHHNDPLVPSHTQDGIVARRPSSSRVNKDRNLPVDRWKWPHHAEHKVKVAGRKELLCRVKTKPSQLALDEVRSICHGLAQTSVARPRLPSAEPKRNSVLPPDKFWKYELLFDMDMDNTST